MKQEHFWWAFLHNCIAHPVMFLCRYPAWSERFHDWTAARAWPDGHGFQVVSDRGAV